MLYNLLYIYIHINIHRYIYTYIYISIYYHHKSSYQLLRQTKNRIANLEILEDAMRHQVAVNLIENSNTREQSVENLKPNRSIISGSGDISTFASRPSTPPRRRTPCEVQSGRAPPKPQHSAASKQHQGLGLATSHATSISMSYQPFLQVSYSSYPVSRNSRNEEHEPRLSKPRCQLSLIKLIQHRTAFALQILYRMPQGCLGRTSSTTWLARLNFSFHDGLLISQEYFHQIFLFSDGISSASTKTWDRNLKIPVAWHRNSVGWLHYGSILLDQHMELVWIMYVAYF